MSNPARLRLLLLLVALTTFISVSRRDLYVGDETKYAQVIRSMRAEHSFFVPTLNGDPFTHKPPLHFWLVYGLVSLFGVNSTWPFVLPALAAFLALLFVVQRTGQEFFSPLAGTAAAFVVGTFYLIWGLAQTARMDLEFAVLVSAAVLYVARFLETSAFRSMTMAGLFTGLAILVKGPMALVIVVLLLAFEAVARRGLPRGNYWPAVALAALIPLAWVIPAVLLAGGRFAEELLVKQNVGRAVSSWTHREPPWYYVAHYPGTFFPWFLLAIFAAVALYRRPYEAVRAWRVRFCVKWFLAVLIPFSLISGKLDVYMVPATIPVALLCGAFLTGEQDDSFARRGIWANRGVVVLLGLAGLVAPLAATRFRSDDPEWVLFDDPHVKGLFASMVVVAVAALVMMAFLRDRRLFRSGLIVGAVSLFPLVYAVLFLIPLANQLGSTQELIRTLARQPYRGPEIGLYSSPFLWSRTLPESLSNVRYIGEKGLDTADPPRLVATQRRHAADLGPKLQTDYVKIDEFRMRGRWFDVYRKR